MQFQVLGPVQACTSDGRPVPLAGDRQRLLLAALLAQAGRAVPADALIDALWNEGLPDHPAAALQSQVHRLRRILATADGRSGDWQKLKCLASQELVIGGWTEPSRSRVGLGALLSLQAVSAGATTPTPCPTPSAASDSRVTCPAAPVDPNQAAYDLLKTRLGGDIARWSTQCNTTPITGDHIWWSRACCCRPRCNWRIASCW